MNITGLLHFIFWVYIITETLICFWRMHKGKNLEQLFKYIVAAMVPTIGVLIFLFYPDKTISVAWLIPDVSVAWFFWPVTSSRFFGGFKNRVSDE